MKFALVNGERSKSRPELRGKCQACGQDVIAKCGPIRMHHWAHVAKTSCDGFREKETRWHRDWKETCPEEWQECRVTSPSGAWRVADVRTPTGVVVEFQHSYLKDAVRRARETFHQNLIWVVDGSRRKNDRRAFGASIEKARLFNYKIATYQISVGNSALLRDWWLSRKAVYFDFGQKVLWYLPPKQPERCRMLLPVWRSEFIAYINNDAATFGIDFSEDIRFWKRRIWSLFI